MGPSSISLTHVGHRYILPQHHLFQLAERSPKDLPSLLNVFRSVPPVIKRRANELLDEIRAAGSENTDMSRSEKAEAHLGQACDVKSVKNVIEGDANNGSGMISPAPPPPTRTHRCCIESSPQLVTSSQTLFGVRQTSYKATSSLLLGAGFSAVGRGY